jgi:uncharacterized protein
LDWREDIGGAELRLPYPAGTLKLPLKTAVPINLAVSLITLAASLPARLLALNVAPLKPFAYDTVAVAVGAVVAAYLGVDWLRRVSTTALTRAVFVLLLALGLSMMRLVRDGSAEIKPPRRTEPRSSSPAARSRRP